MYPKDALMLRRLVGRVALLTATCLLGLVSIVGSGGGGDDPPPPPPPPPESAALQIPATLQQTSVWCWAASAEMIFRYYGLPNVNPFGNYQCGIIAAWFSGTACAIDCSLCQVPVGPMSSMQRVIDGYGPFVRSIGGSSRVLSSSLIFRALSKQEIASEIASGRPIVVGIAPGGGFALPNASQHIAVVIGYDFTSGRQNIVINDPFPFQFPPYSQYPNPYVRVGGAQLGIGRYTVPYDALVLQLGWANTIYAIQ